MSKDPHPMLPTLLTSSHLSQKEPKSESNSIVSSRCRMLHAPRMKCGAYAESALGDSATPKPSATSVAVSPTP